MKTIILIILLPLSLFGQELTQEQRIVAMTILGEARGEGEAGMYAVACVIAQRAVAWKKTPTKVCLQKLQFSCWNPDDPNRAKLPHLLNIPQAAYAKRLAIHLYRIDRTWIKNADHYCTLGTHKYWTKGQKIVAVVGGQKFYKLR